MKYNANLDSHVYDIETPRIIVDGGKYERFFHKLDSRSAGGREDQHPLRLLYGNHVSQFKTK